MQSIGAFSALVRNETRLVSIETPLISLKNGRLVSQDGLWWLTFQWYHSNMLGLPVDFLTLNKWDEAAQAVVFYLSLYSIAQK